MLMEEVSPKRIIVLGGGFVGVAVAMELERRLARDRVEIRLVNRDNFFLFTPMLHEVAASDLDLSTIVNPVRKLIRKVKFFAGEIEHIDLAERKLSSPTDSIITSMCSSSITSLSASGR